MKACSAARSSEAAGASAGAGARWLRDVGASLAEAVSMVGAAAAFCVPAGILGSDTSHHLCSRPADRLRGYGAARLGPGTTFPDPPLRPLIAAAARRADDRETGVAMRGRPVP